MSELLAVEGLTAGYGDAVVVEDVALTLGEGDSLALLGRNGMGKTTLLVTLMGLTRVRGGTMRWRGSDLAALPTHRRSRIGLGWVPQERYMFPSLTVEEHLTAVARPGRFDVPRIYAIFPRLRERGFGRAVDEREVRLVHGHMRGDLHHRGFGVRALNAKVRTLKRVSCDARNGRHADPVAHQRMRHRHRLRDGRVRVRLDGREQRVVRHDHGGRERRRQRQAGPRVLVRASSRAPEPAP